MFRSIALCVLAVLPLLGQLTDVEPPKLTAFDFTPKAVNTTISPANITFTAMVTDNLSGAVSVRVLLRSPSGRVFLPFYMAGDGGTPLAMRFRTTYPFPQFTEPGPWKVDQLTLQDSVGNNAWLSTAILETAGFPATLDVTSSFDLVAPEVNAFAFEHGDVSLGQQGFSLRVRLRLVDALAGVEPNSASCPLEMFSISSPSNIQRHFIFGADFVMVSGDRWDGIWEGTLHLPRYAENGEWRTPVIQVGDRAGNCRRYSTALEIGLINLLPFGPSASKILRVLPGESDVTPPQLTSLSFTPMFINTTQASETVKIRVGLKDSPANATWNYYGYWVGAFFTSPSGQQFRGSSFAYLGSRIFEFGKLVSGTAADGVWETELVFPRYSEAGTWRLRLDNWDNVLNFKSYGPDDLKNLGLPAEVIVITPSGQIDGTFGFGTTTIKDSVFGDRASITAPPNVIAGGTQVAIDVLQTPPAVPIPTGFVPGSPFVTFELTPPPAYPLPAPGLTIVLPLSSARIPGSSVFLYRVNPTTGRLESTGVIGTVNGPDGLSATFSGVLALSTVIALVPDILPVSIDIMPGSNSNPINTASQGVVPVALRGSAGFNVGTTNVAKLWFGPANARPVHNLADPLVFADHLKDTNGDGYLDLVLHFKQEETGLSTADSQACLYGENLQAMPLSGCDRVLVK